MNCKSSGYVRGRYLGPGRGYGTQILRVERGLRTVIVLAGALAVAGAACGFSSGAGAGAQLEGSGKGRVTGLAVPRYVSLKASRVNLRKGPGTKYPTAWVFREAGLPVEIVGEFEAWRKIRDSEGTQGWVLRTLLSGRRTVQVSPWDANSAEERPRVAVTLRPDATSRAVVLVEAGVVADVQSCDGQWCFVRITKFGGYVPQIKLWGVYNGERLP